MANSLKRTKQIRAINDALRQDMPHGSVIISREVGQRFSNDELRAITQLIQTFDTFGPNNEPDELHDTGIIGFEGVQLVWRIEIPTTYPTFGAPTRPTIRISFNHEAQR